MFNVCGISIDKCYECAILVHLHMRERRGYAARGSMYPINIVLTWILFRIITNVSAGRVTRRDTSIRLINIDVRAQRAREITSRDVPVTHNQRRTRMRCTGCIRSGRAVDRNFNVPNQHYSDVTLLRDLELSYQRRHVLTRRVSKYRGGKIASRVSAYHQR